MQNVPNEANVNLYGLCGYVREMRNQRFSWRPSSGSGDPRRTREFSRTKPTTKSIDYEGSSDTREISETSGRHRDRQTRTEPLNAILRNEANFALCARRAWRSATKKTFARAVGAVGTPAPNRSADLHSGTPAEALRVPRDSLRKCEIRRTKPTLAGPKSARTGRRPPLTKRCSWTCSAFIPIWLRGISPPCEGLIFGHIFSGAFPFVNIG
jgi:hypothetical protein